MPTSSFERGAVRSSLTLQAPTDTPRDRLRRMLADNAYPGYVYGYPHKKAYRPLSRPVRLGGGLARSGEEHPNQRPQRQSEPAHPPV